MKKLLIWTLGIGLVLFCAFAIFTFSTIYKQVEKISMSAMTNFNKNAIESLTDLINSENFSFEEKNTAIWALGQFADPKALPLLEKLNSETREQNRCDRKDDLCKMEIERAIKWCKKGNATKWMYRKLNVYNRTSAFAQYLQLLKF